MARIPFLKTHSRFREMADAYIDGELRPGDVAKFEVHASGCAECTALLEAGKALKATMGAIPMAQAPRSFRITPALLREQAPTPAAMRASPVLMVARFGAAASVAAFGVVGTLQLSGPSADEPTTAASPMYELSGAGAAEDTKVDGASGDTGEGSDDPGSQADPFATEDPQIAPPPSADVGGAGVPDATPAPGEPVTQSSGEVSPEPGTDVQRSGDDGGEAYANDGDLTVMALPSDSDGGTDYGPWLVVLGGASIVSLAAVGSMEYRRRRA